MKKITKKLFTYFIMSIVGSLLFVGNVYAKTTLHFTCIDNDNVSLTQSFVDFDEGEEITEFMLPNYCFTGTGCTLEFNRDDLTAIGKVDFGSGSEYFYLNQGTGVKLYESGGPHAVDAATYASKYNLVEIGPSFTDKGKAVIWMGNSEEENRWLTFYNENYLGFNITNHDTMPFPEMFLTQGMNFTKTENKEIQLFYGMKNLELEIEQGKIVTDLKVKSGDNVSISKIGEDYTVGSNNLVVNNKYKFTFENLYKPTNEVMLEMTYFKNYHTFNTALAIESDTLAETEKVDKKVTFTRSAFNNDYLEFRNEFKVRYLAKAEFYYCDSILENATTCTKNDFNPYLQLIYYKDNVVVGTEQVRVHDFKLLEDRFDQSNPENGKTMDDLTSLNVNRNYQIPITIDVANNKNAAVRDADKIAYYLTDGKIEATSDTMPSLSFGIGAGLQIERND